MMTNLLFNFTKFCIIITTKLLTLSISFPTAVNAELVAKPVILGILFSISVILTFKSVFLASSLVSGIYLYASLIFFTKSDLSVSSVVFKTNVVSMLATFATNFSYTVFLTTSFFTTLLSFAKSLGTGVNLSISNLSTSVFKLAKFHFSTKLLTSTFVTFFKSVFVT